MADFNNGLTVTGTATLPTVNIDGGTVDGAVIGGAVPVAGSFTALSATGALTTAGLKEDASGNLGLGVVPSAWVDDKALQLPQGSVSSGYEYGISVAAGAYRSASNVWRYTQSAASVSRFTQVNGAHQWFTALSGTAGQPISFTQAMTLNASGNLGLGVVPSAWNTGKVLQVGTGGSFIFDDGEQTITGFNCYYNAGWIYKNTGYATKCETSVGQYRWYTAPSGTAGQPISFTQAMTLDASGNLLVGMTSHTIAPASGVSLVGLNGGVSYTTIGHILGTPSANAYSFFCYNSTVIGSITQSGTTAVLYNTTSDARLKENITNAGEAANLIDALQVRQFDWKSDGSHQRFGFVAQELYEVAPEAVSKPQDPDEMMAVDYSKLVPMLVKEIQSLRQRLATAGI